MAQSEVSAWLSRGKNCTKGSGGDNGGGHGHQYHCPGGCWGKNVANDFDKIPTDSIGLNPFGNAENVCRGSKCPKGYKCVNGICKLSGGGGTFCNCQVRPIPFQCGQICGFKAFGTPGDATTFSTISYYSPRSIGISFSLIQAEKISVSVYDMTGRLVKTLADKVFEPGKSELRWDLAEVNSGIYVIRVICKSYSEVKKIVMAE